MRRFKRSVLGIRCRRAVMFTAALAFMLLLKSPVGANHVTGGGKSFLFLQPGFTQDIFGVSQTFMGGVAFAPDGDPWVDQCTNGSPLHRYDAQSSPPPVHTFPPPGTSLHTESIVPSNAGCGLTNGVNSLYTNTSSGVIKLNENTGAQTGGPFGPGGNALGITVQPSTGDLIYVGSSGTLYKVNAALTTSSTFSTVTAGNFVDGIAFDPTGKFLFVSNRSPSFRLTILDGTTGTLVQHVPMTSEPDGIGFHAAAPKFVVTNNTNGTLTRFDFPFDDYTMVPIQSVFASGGFRGDLSQVGSDGCMYLTQGGTRYNNGDTTGENSLVRICGGFAPPIPDAPITARGITFGATEGVTFTGAVATFTDPDPNSTAAEYKATIDWGDSTPITPGTISGPMGGPFTVSGTHMYAEEGSYVVTVVITDIDTPSNTDTAHSKALVSDAKLSSKCATAPFSTQTYAGTTAVFTDQSSTGTLSDFSATINWGDSSSSPGTITGGPGNAPYVVSGTHTYTSTGTFLVTTTINDVGGSTTTTPACSVLVFAFATEKGAAFVIGDLEAGLGKHVTWWSSQWANINQMSGGAPPDAMKGFAGFEDNFLGLPPPNCGGTWSTDPGNSTPPPPSVPAFMGVIVSSKITKSGSIISGDIKQVVVVKNDPGYSPSPGHPGTGTELAILCITP